MDLDSQLKQAVDYIGDTIIANIGGWLDRGWSAALTKASEFGQSVSSGISNGWANLKQGVSDYITPNSIGKPKSDATPATEVSKSNTISPPAAPKIPEKEIGEMLQSAGFQASDLGTPQIQAFDLGEQATVGYDNVGCAPNSAARGAYQHAPTASMYRTL